MGELEPTEGRAPGAARLDQLPTVELVRLLSREDARAAAAVAAIAPAVAAAIEAVAERLAAGGRLVYLGAGTSGRLGVLDASECPPTFGCPPEQVSALIAGGREALHTAVEGAEDDERAAPRELAALGLGPRDALVGIAASGRTPYTLAGLRRARELGAWTVALTCSPGSPLGAAADLALEPEVGPEVLSGSTRLKAGTATKLILNQLSTGVMVRLGKTYGDLMVDLRASNHKLRRRALRLVQTIAGVDEGAAEQALARCGGEVKVAVLGLLAGVEPAQARARLAAAGGRLAQALGPLDRRG
jgi:N-acetylmuramic acid 6-phosphate etherase